MTQLDCVPNKSPGNGAAYYREWIDTIKEVTLSDLNIIFGVLNLNKAAMYTCVAISGGANSDASSTSDIHGHTPPSLMRRP